METAENPREPPSRFDPGDSTSFRLQVSGSGSQDPRTGRPLAGIAAGQANSCLSRPEAESAAPAAEARRKAPPRRTAWRRRSRSERLGDLPQLGVAMTSPAAGRWFGAGDFLKVSPPLKRCAKPRKSFRPERPRNRRNLGKGEDPTRSACREPALRRRRRWGTSDSSCLLQFRPA